MTKIFDKKFLLIVLFYTLSYGLILMNKGIYWDDWTLFNTDKTVIIGTFNYLGIPWLGFVYAAFLALPHAILIHRIFVFLSFLISVLSLSLILKKYRIISDEARFYIVVFFALFPVNSVRVAFISSLYTFCYVIFFISFWLLSEYLSKRKLVLRILSLFLFFISFFTSSILFFYILCLFHIWYSESKKSLRFNNVVNTVIKYLDFLFLPLLFWLIKGIYLKSIFLYEGYNSIKLVYFLYSPLNFFISFYEAFIKPFLSMKLSPFLLLDTLGVYYLMKRYRPFKNQVTYIENKIFLFAGIVSFFVAVFPYILVGKVPSSYDWSGRLQLLIPLSSGFFIYSSINFIQKRAHLKDSIRLLLFSLLIAFFIQTNFESFLMFQKDWYKQVSLINNIKQNGVIKKNNTFIFEDNMTVLNANRRIYRFYEYNSLMKYAFGDEKRLGMNALKPVDLAGLKNYEYYSMKDYKKKDFEYKIIINQGEVNLTDQKTVQLMAEELFFPSIFDKEVDKIIELDVIKVN